MQDALELQCATEEAVEMTTGQLDITQEWPADFIETLNAIDRLHGEPQWHSCTAPWERNTIVGGPSCIWCRERR